MRAKTVVLIVVLAALVGGGAVAGTYLLSDEDSAVAIEDLVPRNAFFYMEASRNLSPSQREACDSLVARFPEGDSCGAIAEEIRSSLDDQLSKEDMSFDEDIEPWLGDDFAVYVTSDDLGSLIQQSTQPTIDAMTVESDPSDDVAQGAEEEAPLLPTATLLAAIDDEDKARSFFADVQRASDEEASDEGEPDEGLETRSYEGVEYYYKDGGAWSFFDGYMALGTEAGVKATIDQRDADDTLEDNSRFSTALQTAREDRLGLMYLDLKPVLDAGLQQLPTGVPPGLFSGYLQAFDKPVTITAHLQETGFVFESTGLAAEDLAGGSPTTGFEVSEALEALPDGSFGAVGIADPAASLRSFVDLGANFFFVPGGAGGQAPNLEEEFRRRTGLDIDKDILSWMGPGGAFVASHVLDGIYGGVMIETSDPDASLRTILQIERLIASEAKKQAARQAKILKDLPPRLRKQVRDQMGPQEPTKIISRRGFRGFIMPVPGQKQVGIVAVDDERVVIALASPALLDRLAVGDRLETSDVYNDAQEVLGEGFTMSGFLDIDVIRDLVEREQPPNEMYATQVRPFLEPLGHLVFGSMKDGGIVRDRLVIGVE